MCNYLQQEERRGAATCCCLCHPKSLLDCQRNKAFFFSPRHAHLVWNNVQRTILISSNIFLRLVRVKTPKTEWRRIAVSTAGKGATLYFKSYSIFKSWNVLSASSFCFYSHFCVFFCPFCNLSLKSSTVYKLDGLNGIIRLHIGRWRLKTDRSCWCMINKRQSRRLAWISVTLISVYLHVDYHQHLSITAHTYFPSLYEYSL